MASFSSGGVDQCAHTPAASAAAGDIAVGGGGGGDVAGGGAADAGWGRGGGGGLFIGSFNLNSEDLTAEAAAAWLKQAGDADIVALGLQVIFFFQLVSFSPLTN